jgi:ABC-type transport system involved in cytochrome c biogenesis permease subunit
MSFIANITITCFLASYAVALGLEISRLFFRSGVRGALMLAFGAAGLVAHTLYLGHRAASAAFSPLASEFDFYLVAAWVLAAMYLHLTVYHPHNPIGLFLLPLVILFVAGASLFADPNPFPRSTATQSWGMVHGVCLLLGTVAVTVGFVTGCMYLLQAHRLKKKLPPSGGLRLPSLEWLQKMNARTIGVAVLMLLGGFLSGIVLNLTRRTQGEAAVPWSDPVVLSSSLLVGWMIAAWLFSVLYKPAQQGRKVAYLTVASFVFLLIALISILTPTQHGNPSTSIQHPASSIQHLAHPPHLQEANA